MKLGIALPTAGTHASTQAITTIADTAEQIGLDSVWSFERQLSPVGEVAMGEHKMRLPDIYNNVFSPLEALAYVAARTSRVRLGTSVIVAPLHNPVALGRSFATLDQLSNGRVIAGLGQGWMQEEFDAAGVEKSRQGAGFGEFIEAMRAVWGPDPVGFDGRFYTIASSNVSPKPVQPGGPPVVVGAAAPASIQRTARLGLGLNPIWFGWEALEATVQAFHAAVDEAGRDRADLPVVLRINEPLPDTPTDDGPSPIGSPEQAADALPRLEQLGVTEVFWAMNIPVEEQVGLMTQLVEMRDRA